MSVFTPTGEPWTCHHGRRGTITDSALCQAVVKEESQARVLFFKSLKIRFYFPASLLKHMFYSEMYGFVLKNCSRFTCLRMRFFRLPCGRCLIRGGPPFPWL